MGKLTDAQIRRLTNHLKKAKSYREIAYVIFRWLFTNVGFRAYDDLSELMETERNSNETDTLIIRQKAFEKGE